MSEQMHICYHGTTQENADSILRFGFRSGTYFATHMEDAVGFGGVYLFEVVFPKSQVPDYWEFIVDEVVQPDRIVKLSIIYESVVMDNPELRQTIFESNAAGRE